MEKGIEKTEVVEPKEIVEMKTYKASLDTHLGIVMIRTKGEEEVIIASEVALKDLMGFADLIYNLNGK